MVFHILAMAMAVSLHVVPVAPQWPDTSLRWWLTPAPEMIRVAAMEPRLIPVDANQLFDFACHPAVACFNTCCHDLNHFLYPYDVLRLSRHLRLPSGVFLERYARVHAGPETGLPVATLRLDPARRMACPFVGSAGCSVYPDRPAACRLYPLARAVRRSADTGRLSEHFALIQEAHCLGHGSGRRLSIAAWVQDQGLTAYHRMNDPFVEVIAVKRCAHPQSLSLAEEQLVRQALYDLDRFRERVLARPAGDPLTASSPEIEQLATDNEALLLFAYRWVAALLQGPARPEPVAGRH